MRNVLWAVVIAMICCCTAGCSENEEGEKTIAVTSVVLDKTAVTLAPTTTQPLSATVAPDNATDKTVAWESSDERIATVDAEGVVTAVAEGTATVTARAGEAAAECRVTVSTELAVVTLAAESLADYPRTAAESVTELTVTGTLNDATWRELLKFINVEKITVQDNPEGGEFRTTPFTILKVKPDCCPPCGSFRPPTPRK